MGIPSDPVLDLLGGRMVLCVFSLIGVLSDADDT
jgi:hypothetical protein